MQVLSGFGLAPYRLSSVITGHQSTPCSVLRFSICFEQSSDGCFFNIYTRILDASEHGGLHLEKGTSLEQSMLIILHRKYVKFKQKTQHTNIPA